MIEEAKTYLDQKNLSEKAEIKKEDLLRLESYPEADLSIALGLFDYISDPENIIKKAHISSNYLVASWPTPGIRNYLRKFRYTCSVYTYTINEVSSLFSNIGIKDLYFIDLGGFSGFLTISCRD